MAEFARTLETLEIVGGALCLDFVNTINSRVNPEHDYLANYSELADWANRIGILSSTQNNQLKKQSKGNVQEAEIALQLARRLRELLYRLFSNAAKGTEPKQEDMEIFVGSYGEAISNARFLKIDDHYEPGWKMDQAFAAPLWPILHSAGELFLSSELSQVKECPGCGWLFLDTSKNGSRRWCSMNTCGARDKMRRYHKKQRAS